METVLVLHNPKAGEEDHERKELIHEIRSAGYNCLYTSIRKSKWKRIDDEVDVLLIVGGDGTVREVMRNLLRRTLLDKKLTLSLLPMGTANNIALTLQLPEKIADLLAGWRKRNLQRVDIGVVEMRSQKTFFSEGLGYGVLPKLMREMEQLQTDHLENTEEELRFAQHTLLNLVMAYKGKRGVIQTGEEQIQDRFLLIEVMNSVSVGPNLLLAPEANIGDGIFEIVYITIAQRDAFIHYLDSLLTQKPAKFPGKTIKAVKAEIKWEGNWVHVDDQLIRLKKDVITKVALREGVFNFLLG